MDKVIIVCENELVTRLRIHRERFNSFSKENTKKLSLLKIE